MVTEEYSVSTGIDPYENMTDDTEMPQWTYWLLLIIFWPICKLLK